MEEPNRKMEIVEDVDVCVVGGGPVHEPSWDSMTDYHDIPYACLVPCKTDNLIISGRCISADHFAMSSVRVNATCMAIGEAAGTAASLCLSQNKIPQELKVNDIQKELRNTGGG